MARALIVLAYPSDRQKAIAWISKAPVNTRLEFRAPKRTLPQNDLMWELLTQLSCRLQWHGLKLSAEDYKDLLTASMRRELRTVPNISGDGFVILGQRTSDMSREEMSTLIELIYAFGAEHDVVFHEPSNQTQNTRPPSPTRSNDRRTVVEGWRLDPYLHLHWEGDTR